jgi:UDP:flavonoid glycosyltransferase YjiC (YdhE family)
MAGPRILFIWELGDGLGHVSRMLPLARQLQGAGATCVFAVRNVENSHKILGDTGMALLQAPITHPVTDYTGKAAIGSYGDIMETVGYGRVDRLYPLLCAWDGLYQTVEPDLIVADYAPTALLAARGRIPALAIGDWFTLPPSTLDAFPHLRDGGPRIPESDLLEVVRDSQQRRNALAPAALPGILDCAASAIITLPELDCYAHLRKRPAVGPFLPLPAPLETRRWEVDYFAYLSLGFRPTSQVLEALVSMPVQGSIYLRDASARQRDEWRDRGLIIYDSPQDMREMAANSAVIIHHGGLGTIETVFALGRPQMLVPRHHEQAVNSQMVGRLGLAVGMQSGGRFKAVNIVQALRHAIKSTPLHENAARKAAELAERGPFNALESVAEFCLTTLDKGINS